MIVTGGPMVHESWHDSNNDSDENENDSTLPCHSDFYDYNVNDIDDGDNDFDDDDDDDFSLIPGTLPCHNLQDDCCTRHRAFVKI